MNGDTPVASPGHRSHCSFHTSLNATSFSSFWILRSSTKMISKNLTIAAALVLISGLGFGPAVAQNTPPPRPPWRRQVALPARPQPRGGTMAPAATPAPAAAARCAVITPPAASAAPTENPYGLGDIVAKRNPVSITILVHPRRHVGRHLVHLLHEVLRAVAHPRRRRARSRSASGPRARWTKASTSCRRTRCSAASPMPASAPARAAPAWSASTTGSPCR